MSNPHLYNSHLEGDPFFWKIGPTGVLLMHGFTATPAEVRPLAQRLTEAGYSAAGPLLAGHGTHPDDLNLTRWEDWTASAEAAYHQLAAECSQVFVGGASMGALVALWLAASHPEVKGIILFAPGIETTTPRWKRIVLQVAAPFISQISRNSLDNPEFWQGYPDIPLKGAVQLFRFQKAMRARLKEIRQPLLVFQGRKDFTIPSEAGEMILQGVSSKEKRLHWMEQSTHEVTLDGELPEVSRMVIEFIQTYAA